jgi:polysaccharide pyruvyl transferase WcaK-like protein
MTPATTPIRLALFGVPLSGNKGSASMTLGLLDAFSQAGIDARFELFSYYPCRDAQIARQTEPKRVHVHQGHPKDLAFKLCPMLATRAVPRRQPGREAVQALRESDLVLLVGGTTFADSMLYKVPWNVLAAVPAYLEGKPTIFASQTLGPTESWLNRASAGATLRRATEVHGRGRTSERHARALGVDACTYRPDLSFTMRVPAFSAIRGKCPPVAALAETIDRCGQLPIGVAPNSIVQRKARQRGLDYVGFLAELIRDLARRGFLPVLIPHSYRAETSAAHNNDRSLCAAVLDRLGPDANRVAYLDADLDPRQLRAVIGRMHLLIASRFHSMVSALAMGVPPITFGWGHHKYTEVLDEFGVTEALYCPYDRMDRKTTIAMLDRVLGEREGIARQITDRLGPIRRDAESLPLHLLRLVRGEGSAIVAA